MISYLSLFSVFIFGILYGASVVNKAHLLRRIYPEAAPYEDILYGVRIALWFFILYGINTWVDWHMVIMGAGGFIILTVNTPALPRSFTESQLMTLLRKQLRSIVLYFAALVLYVLLR